MILHSTVTLLCVAQAQALASEKSKIAFHLRGCVIMHHVPKFLDH